MRRFRFARTTLAAALGAALGLGCAQAPDDGAATAATTRIENASLGLAFADLPSRCEVAVNRGDELSLACLGEDGADGELLVELRPPEEGTNLLEAAKAQKGEFEALPGGAFHGNRELVTPGGAAYTARGRYDGEAGPREESRVIALHPNGDRAVILRLVYPEGDDTKWRIDQLLYLVGEMEGLEAPAGGGGEGDDGGGGGG